MPTTGCYTPIVILFIVDNRIEAGKPMNLRHANEAFGPTSAVYTTNTLRE